MTRTIYKGDLMTELADAIRALHDRQHAVQAALLADFMEAGRLANEGRLEDPDVPIPSPWNLADAYRRLFVGMDLDADELLEHARQEGRQILVTLLDGLVQRGVPVAALADLRQEAYGPLPEDPQGLGQLGRAMYLHAFSEAAMLFLRRAERTEST